MYRCQVQRNTVEVYLSKTKKNKHHTHKNSNQFKPHQNCYIFYFSIGGKIFNENQNQKKLAPQTHIFTQKPKLFINQLIYFIEPELREFIIQIHHSLFLSFYKNLSMSLSSPLFLLCFESFISVEERFQWLKNYLFVCLLLLYLFMCNQIYLFFRFQILTKHTHKSYIHKSTQALSTLLLLF